MGSLRRKNSNWRLRTLACVFAAALILVGVVGYIGATGFSAVCGESSGTAGQTNYDSSVSHTAAAKHVGSASELATGFADEATAPESAGDRASGFPESGSQQKTASLPEHIALDETPDIAPVEAEHEPDTVLLNVGEGTSTDAINDLIRRMDFVTTEDVSDQDLSLGFVELSLVPGTDVARAAYTLEKTGVVEGAQPNYIYHLLDDGAGEVATGATSAPGALAATGLQLQSTAVNDPMASSQWALEAVHAYEAWDIAKTNQTVTVAVVDNGCIVEHEDLKGNIVARYNAVKNNTDVSHVTSSYHGTHVAGIVGAAANNSLGVVGVSYNAHLLPIQVFEVDNDGKEGASSTSILKAYIYIKRHAAEYNIKVVNMSVGGELSSYDRIDKLLIDAIESAYKDGIVSVCAAGNNSSNTSAYGCYKCFPVDYSENIVGVINLEKNESASDGTGVSVASSSNYNMPGQTTKDISAPGSNILSTYGSYATSYSRQSGTSMATPLVAGIVALEFAADPDLSAAEAVDALYAGATDLLGDGVWDENTGYGMVDAYKTIQALDAGMSGADAVAVGESTQLKPTKYDASSWSWRSSDTGIATVDSNGNVTGKAVGTVTVSAARGNLTAAKELVVHESAFSNSAYIAPKGKPIKLSISTTLPSGRWSFDSSDSSIATVANVSGTITVTGKSAGTVTITAKNNTYGVTISTKVTVYAPSIVDADSLDTNLSVLKGHNMVVKLENQPEGNWTWGSSAEEVATVVVDADDSTKATVTGVNSGQATITATLAGNDSFTVSAPVEVGTIEMSDENTEIVLSSNSFTFSPAGPCEPDFTVKHNRNTLDSNYYTYSYTNNKNAGKATLTITGRNNYVGKVSKDFIIDPCPVDDVVISTIADQSYSGSGLRPSLTVTHTLPVSGWLPIPILHTTYTLVAGSDYALSYANNVDVGTATVTLAGVGNYTGTRTVTFTIKPTDIHNVSVESVASCTYTGSTIMPEPLIAYKGKTLKAGTDYTLAYANNVDAGKATIAITGKGGFTGTKNVKFSIERAPLSDVAVKGVTDMTYTGSALKPVPVLSYKGRTLEADADYTVAYSGNTKAGWARVILTSRGNYIGSKYVMFKISKADNSIALSKTRVKKTIKTKLLKKKAKNVALPKATATFGDAQWSVYKKDAKKVLTLKNGKIRVKKGAKKGVYTIKLLAEVAGTSNYASAASKVVTVKVRVK